MTKNLTQAVPIIILDFGSQYTQLIARRIREMKIYCEVHPFDVSLETLKRKRPKGLILSGGPTSVHKAQAYSSTDVFSLSIPILGICYGMQMMAFKLGGQVTSSDAGEYGQAECDIINESALFSGVSGSSLNVWMSHGDCVCEVPSDFKIVAKTSHAPIAAMENSAQGLYGLQFHPEVTHTIEGAKILHNFAIKICGCAKSWEPENIIDDSIQYIQQRVGSEGVILGLSGGVDSSVVAALLHQAIPDQLTCLFVDNGLLRQGEVASVKHAFQEGLGIKLICVDAKQRFLEALAGINDPEKKRKVIGGIFVDIFEEEAQKLNGIKWLAQGTIYPDVIESASQNGANAHTIKSHHNVGGLPERMQLKLVEPLRSLFKDEVRLIGKKLGLPDTLIYRHPFPGPGLAIRIMGEVQPAFLTLLRKCDYIFMEMLHTDKWYHQLAQAFCVFLPVKSVGVIGDKRNHAHVVCLRAVTSEDYMTADVATLPFDFLQKVANRIVNEVPGISRVTYDITRKPPATIEWE